MLKCECHIVAERSLDCWYSLHLWAFSLFSVFKLIGEQYSGLIEADLRDNQNFPRLGDASGQSRYNCRFLFLFIYFLSMFKRTRFASKFN